MGTSSGSYPMINDAGLTQSFLFQNLADGKTYYFIVTAYDQMQNQSVPSEEVNVQIPDSTSPTPPENVTLAASSNSEISFTWTASRDNVGVTGYQDLLYLDSLQGQCRRNRLSGRAGYGCHRSSGHHDLHRYDNQSRQYLYLYCPSHGCQRQCFRLVTPS
jgi:hypothetical protein